MVYDTIKRELDFKKTIYDDRAGGGGDDRQFVIEMEALANKLLTADG